MRSGLLACCFVIAASMFVSSRAEESSDATSAVASSKTEPPSSRGEESKVGGEHQTGNASFYAHHFSGKKTASGERYDPAALTAAHRSLPMGTRLRVTNPRNDKSVVVTINDRGHLPKGRVVDVSSAAADALDMKKSGVTKVETQIEPTTVGKVGTASIDTTTSDAAAPR